MHRFRLLALSFIFLTITSIATAATPCVQFDVPTAVAAKLVEHAEFAPTHGQEKLIQIRFPISSLVRLGSEDALIQYLYFISSTTTPFQIVEHAPQTALDSDVNGALSVERSRGQSTAFGLKVNLPRDLLVKGDATASHGANSSNVARYEQLPPLQLIAASGTLRRGRAAYFKLKPSTRTTLEGDKTFEITARVPQSWRAGLIAVDCQAFGRPPGVLPYHDQADLVCGSTGFFVGVYLQGDVAAKESVMKLVESQSRLRQLAEVYAKEVQQERYPSWGHKIGAAFAIVKPRIPKGWLEEILASEALPTYERHLPDTLRDAVTEYREARVKVRRFAG